MDKPITVELLEKMEACPASVTLFGRMFPDGASWDDVRQAYAAGGWASCMVAEDKLLRHEYNGYDPRDDLSWFAARCPAGIVPELTWDERVRTCLPNWRIALALCPADVPGATWEARLALLRGASARALFAVRCPEGVAGATPRARERLLWRAAPDAAAATAREAGGTRCPKQWKS